MWNGARQRARKAGLEFTLPLESVTFRMARGKCEVTGLPFSTELGKGKGNSHPFSPSLDRIDPSKGYTTENTQIVAWVYNAAKHVSSHEDVMQMARALTYAGVEA